MLNEKTILRSNPSLSMFVYPDAIMSFKELVHVVKLIMKQYDYRVFLSTCQSQLNKGDLLSIVFEPIPAEICIGQEDQNECRLFLVKCIIASAIYFTF